MAYRIVVSAVGKSCWNIMYCGLRHMDRVRVTSHQPVRNLNVFVRLTTRTSCAAVVDSVCRHSACTYNTAAVIVRLASNPTCVRPRYKSANSWTRSRNKGKITGANYELKHHGFAVEPNAKQRQITNQKRNLDSLTAILVPESRTRTENGNWNMRVALEERRMGAKVQKLSEVDTYIKKKGEQKNCNMVRDDAATVAPHVAKVRSGVAVRNICFPPRQRRAQYPVGIISDTCMWETLRTLPFACVFYFVSFTSPPTHHCISSQFHLHFTPQPSPLKTTAVIPGFSYVGIMPDDAAGRRIFSGISRFPFSAPYSSQSLSSALKTSLNSETSGHVTNAKYREICAGQMLRRTWDWSRCACAVELVIFREQIRARGRFQYYEHPTANCLLPLVAVCFRRRFHIDRPLILRQRRHVSYMIRVQTVNTCQQVIQPMKAGWHRSNATCSGVNVRAVWLVSHSKTNDGGGWNAGPRAQPFANSSRETSACTSFSDDNMHKSRCTARDKHGKAISCRGGRGETINTNIMYGTGFSSHEPCTILQQGEKLNANYPPSFSDSVKHMSSFGVPGYGLYCSAPQWRSEQTGPPASHHDELKLTPGEFKTHIFARVRIGELCSSSIGFVERLFPLPPGIAFHVKLIQRTFILKAYNVSEEKMIGICVDEEVSRQVGAAMAQWLGRSPPIPAIRRVFSGYSRFPALAFQHCSILGPHVISGDDGYLRVPAGQSVTRKWDARAADSGVLAVRKTSVEDNVPCAANVFPPARIRQARDACRTAIGQSVLDTPQDRTKELARPDNCRPLMASSLAETKACCELGEGCGLARWRGDEREGKLHACREGGKERGNLGGLSGCGKV
ncbi:hypothetical protein PR048_009959 [Dryococelus australis]|uniref:Uncharacterized protein n=1 Tax=Dryococelus australis TaxID=614101 RepID=A0ABQ9I1B5_9NEOP|nr:hypothetical protein PR048_009959 [Dryococelus australis]